MEIAIILLLWLFICLQLLVISGLLRLPTHRNKLTNMPHIAILVPARNEEENVASCLSSLLALNYPTDKIEIWVGNDQSTDGTAQIVDTFAKKHPHIHLFQLTGEMGKAKAKANVLAQLVRKCSADYIFVTDADITVGKNWIQGLLPHLQTSNMGMVSGTTLVKGSGFLQAGQSIDWTIGNGYLIGLNQLGMPSTAVGNNMAFTREAYLATGGYETMDFSVTEDFQLFTAIRKCGYQTTNVMEKLSLNYSKPQIQLEKLLHQRKRWMMGAQGLPWYWGIIFGVQAFFYIGLILLFYINPAVAWRIWLIKWVLQQTFVLLIHARLREPLPWKAFLGYELYSVGMHLAMITFFISPTKMDWKGRKY